MRKDQLLLKIFLIAVGLNFNVYAQEEAVEVNGMVADLNGEPLPGVNVTLKDSQTGTITNMEGEYTLNVPVDGILVFSFVGFETKEEQVDGRATINVELGEDVDALDEVVVIGYQQVRRRDLTGATSVVDSEETSRVSANSLGPIWPDGMIFLLNCPIGIPVLKILKLENMSFYLFLSRTLILIRI